MTAGQIFSSIDYFTSVEEVMRSYLGLPRFTETLKLYRNLHNGAFEDVTAKVGLDKVFMPMGANFGDVDNDGYLDIYLGMGTPSFASLVPHVLCATKTARALSISRRLPERANCIRATG